MSLRTTTHHPGARTLAPGLSSKTVAGLALLALATLFAAGIAWLTYGNARRSGAPGGGAPGAENALVVPLKATGNDPIAGAVTVAPSGGDRASVSLVVEGLRPGVTYRAQL